MPQEHFHVSYLMIIETNSISKPFEVSVVREQCENVTQVFSVAPRKTLDKGCKRSKRWTTLFEHFIL